MLLRLRHPSPAMTRLLALGVVLGVSVGGLGLDAAHIAFFVSEPVVLWTAPGEEPVSLTYGGVPWEVAWRRELLGERVRWEGTLPPPAPRGVWVACGGRSCHAFLRVPDEVGIVEVQASPGALVTVGEEARVADASGRAFFVLPPGEHELAANVAGQDVRQRVRIEPRERTAVALFLVSLGTSTGVVLPGTSLTLSARLVVSGDFPTLNVVLVLPEGWSHEPLPGLFDPVVGGRLTVRSWRVSVPGTAPVGEYTLAVKLLDLGLEFQSSLTVAYRLPPRAVVCHWDVTGNRLDLEAPCQVTYERLLWASTRVGEVLPFAGRAFTRGDLEDLAREWEKGR